MAVVALDGMGQEARGIVRILVNTGARPSVIVGIKLTQMRIHEPVPSMEIVPDGRTLGNQNSERTVSLAGVSLLAAREARQGAPDA